MPCTPPMTSTRAGPSVWCAGGSVPSIHVCAQLWWIPRRGPGQEMEGHGQHAGGQADNKHQQARSYSAFGASRLPSTCWLAMRGPTCTAYEGRPEGGCAQPQGLASTSSSFKCLPCNCKHLSATHTRTKVCNLCAAAT
jgi:hypothetical protein